MKANKTKKWLTLALAGTLAVSTAALLAACDNGEKPAPTPTPSGEFVLPDVEYHEDTTHYYITGKGNGTLSQLTTTWSPLDHTLELVKDTTVENANAYKITMDIYSTDAFQITFNDSWDGQMGISYFYGRTENADVMSGFYEVRNADGVAEMCGVITDGAVDGDNISVAAGQDGKYELTLYTFPETDQPNIITYREQPSIQ